MEAVALLSCHLREYNGLCVLNVLHYFCAVLLHNKEMYTYWRDPPHSLVQRYTIVFSFISVLDHQYTADVYNRSTILSYTGYILIALQEFSCILGDHIIHLLLFLRLYLLGQWFECYSYISGCNWYCIHYHSDIAIWWGIVCWLGSFSDHKFINFVYKYIAIGCVTIRIQVAEHYSVAN